MDVEQYIWMTSDFGVTYQNGQLFNPTTNCYGCAYHGNGGEKEKKYAETLYSQMYAKSNLYYIPTRKYEILSDDMILIDFMSEDMCQKMISLAEDRTFNIMAVSYTHLTLPTKA